MRKPFGQIVAFAGCLLASAAWAQTPPPPDGIWDRATLLGTMGGLRTTLDDVGISLTLTQTTDLLGNLTGGRNRGWALEPETEAIISIDLGKQAGLQGGLLYATLFQDFGRGLSRSNLLSLSTPSNDETDPAPSLGELYYQQSFAGGIADVRIGKLSLSKEFMISNGAAQFLSSTFSWPTLPGVVLPGGGSPATPGVRLHLQPSESVLLALGVLNGDPSGAPGPGGAPNRNGTLFPLHNGVMVIGEAQFSVKLGAAHLPGTYKLGGWYNSNTYADLRYDSAGIALGTPGSSGVARRDRGDSSVYALADQMVLAVPGVKDGGVSLFARVMAAQDDRSLVSFYADAGVTLKGMFGGRGDDILGFAASTARISNAARTADLVALQYGTSVSPARTAETVLELTYLAQVTPWLQIQPDIQYYFAPGGGIANPAQPRKRLGDALVVGFRSLVTF